MQVGRFTRLMVAGTSGALALGLMAGPALADTDPDAPPLDPETVEALFNEYMTEFNNADFDGDGSADFADTDGDGIPDIPEGEPGDFDLRPGDGRFGQPITEELQAQGFDTVVVISKSSTLLYDCGGMAWSFDSDGSPVDAAIGVGSSDGGGPTGALIDMYPASDIGKRAFTKSNPFVVRDTVVYFGRLPNSGDGPLNHDWFIKTAGISLDEGGDPNERGRNRNAGEVSVSGDVPGGSFLLPSGIFPMEGELTSTNGLRCTASGWVKLETGSPLLSAPGLVAGAAGIVGVLGLLFNSRPAITWKQG